MKSVGPQSMGVFLVLVGIQSPLYAKAVYYYPDHLGSTLLTTDASGHPIQETAYTPFGEILNEIHFPNDALPLQYTGQTFDRESELSYYGARYYNATLARFVSVDPILSGGALHDPQQRNGYGYARNNPLTYTDPTGQFITPETAYDAISLDLSLAQCAENCDSGWDRAGLAYDAFAVAMPILPAGYGIGKRFSRSPLVRRAVDFAFFGFEQLNNLSDVVPIRPSVIEVGAGTTASPFRIASAVQDVVVSVDPIAIPNPGYYRYFREVMKRVFHYSGTAEDLAQQGVRSPYVVLHHPGPDERLPFDQIVTMIDPENTISQAERAVAGEAKGLVEAGGFVLTTEAGEAFTETFQEGWKRLPEEEVRATLESLGSGVPSHVPVAGWQRLE